MSNGKILITLLIVGLLKRIFLYKKKLFPEPFTHGKNKMELELDLSHSAAKFELINAADVDTSEFATKVDLASLNSTLLLMI